MELPTTSRALEASPPDGGRGADDARPMGLRAPPRRGFTLLELLVVIGIITVLASILFPALSKIARKAQRYKSATLLNTISQALEAYKGDFGDYPRLFEQSPPTSGQYEHADSFAILGVALMGPGPQTSSLTEPNSTTIANPGLPPLYTATTTYPAGSVVYEPNGTSAKFYVCINEFG